MILELGQTLSASSEIIRVTADYSNAVLVAVMPYISDAAQRLELPVPHPLIPAHVSHCNIMPRRSLAVEIGTSDTNGNNWFFAFSKGYVNIVQGPHDYFSEQEPSKVPSYYGKLKMSKAKAVEKARETIQKLGIKAETVFADQEPRVTGPEKVETNTIPQYKVEWLDPRSGFPATVIHIDGESRRVTRIKVQNVALVKPDPEIGVVPPRAPGSASWPPCNPEYAIRLAPIALKAVEALNLGIPSPLTTNHVAKLSLADNGGWPHAEIELTNGWRFIYRNSDVNGYYSPRCFFNSDSRPVTIKEFAGKAKLSTAEAVKLVKNTVARLHYSTNLLELNFEPRVIKPAVAGIPRIMLFWHKENADQTDLVFKLEAEVDLRTGEIASLYFDNMALWNKPPPIHVPLTLPSTNRVQKEEVSTGQSSSRPQSVPRFVVPDALKAP
jgi:hypothetical protein